jgi:hypothetical protein
MGNEQTKEPGVQEAALKELFQQKPAANNTNSTQLNTSQLPSYPNPFTPATLDKSPQNILQTPQRGGALSPILPVYTTNNDKSPKHNTSQIYESLFTDERKRAKTEDISKDLLSDIKTDRSMTKSVRWNPNVNDVHRTYHIVNRTMDFVDLVLDLKFTNEAPILTSSTPMVMSIPDSFGVQNVEPRPLNIFDQSRLLEAPKFPALVSLIKTGIDVEHKALKKVNMEDMELFTGTKPKLSITSTISFGGNANRFSFKPASSDNLQSPTFVQGHVAQTQPLSRENSQSPKFNAISDHLNQFAAFGGGVQTTPAEIGNNNNDKPEQPNKRTTRGGSIFLSKLQKIAETNENVPVQAAPQANGYRFSLQRSLSDNDLAANQGNNVQLARSEIVNVHHTHSDENDADEDDGEDPRYFIQGKGTTPDRGTTQSLKQSNAALNESKYRLVEPEYYSVDATEKPKTTRDTPKRDIASIMMVTNNNNNAQHQPSASPKMIPSTIMKQAFNNKNNNNNNALNMTTITTAKLKSDNVNRSYSPGTTVSKGNGIMMFKSTKAAKPSTYNNKSNNNNNQPNVITFNLNKASAGTNVKTGGGGSKILNDSYSKPDSKLDTSFKKGIPINPLSTKNSASTTKGFNFTNNRSTTPTPPLSRVDFKPTTARQNKEAPATFEEQKTHENLQKLKQSMQNNQHEGNKDLPMKHYKPFQQKYGLGTEPKQMHTEPDDNGEEQYHTTTINQPTISVIQFNTAPNQNKFEVNIPETSQIVDTNEEEVKPVKLQLDLSAFRKKGNKVPESSTTTATTSASTVPNKNSEVPSKDNSRQKTILNTVESTLSQAISTPLPRDVDGQSPKRAKSVDPFLAEKSQRPNTNEIDKSFILHQQFEDLYQNNNAANKRDNNEKGGYNGPMTSSNKQSLTDRALDDSLMKSFTKDNMQYKSKGLQQLKTKLQTGNLLTPSKMGNDPDESTSSIKQDISTDRKSEYNDDAISNDNSIYLNGAVHSPEHREGNVKTTQLMKGRNPQH